MKFHGLLLLSLLLVCSLNTDSANRVHVCFDLKPMPDFDISKFVGLWYAVETSVRPNQCLVNEFSHTLKNANETGRNTGTPRDDEEPKVYKHFYIGGFTIDPELPSRLTTCPALSDDVFSASFVVFATDYVTYAGVYSCQETPTGRKHTVTIMSRTETLDELTIEKLKKSIRSTGYNMSLLKKVDHSGCKHRYLKFNDNKIYSYVNFQTNEVLPKEIVTQMDALNLT